MSVQVKLGVELPVCPVEGCHRVGKLPTQSFKGTSYCSGSVKEPHKKTRIESRRFEEVA